ncbi:MAG: hypothetical protein KAS32_14265 [Candidatus Peribacteraceae bacterium]|nr:hypothetical protein [Candidatus Peribacteraceae bacterium]
MSYTVRKAKRERQCANCGRTILRKENLLLDSHVYCQFTYCTSCGADKLIKEAKALKEIYKELIKDAWKPLTEVKNASL